MKTRTSERREAGFFTSTRRALSRRGFLRSAAVTLSLPLLDAMRPAFAAESSAATTDNATPRRMFAICNNLGMLPDEFFPRDSGRNYSLSPYLETLKEHRNHFTVFSGVWHPDVDGGHPADICFLTAAPHPARGGFRNTISLDQFIAERVGHLTRFPSLNLSVNAIQGYRSLSWTSSGVLIPSDESPASVFRRLFVDGTHSDAEVQVRKLALGESILDAVADQAKHLQRKLGGRDRDRLDQYFSSVRELERRMSMARAGSESPDRWSKCPSPWTPPAAGSTWKKCG